MLAIRSAAERYAPWLALTSCFRVVASIGVYIFFGLMSNHWNVSFVTHLLSWLSLTSDLIVVTLVVESIHWQWVPPHGIGQFSILFILTSFSKVSRLCFSQSQSVSDIDPIELGQTYLWFFFFMIPGKRKMPPGESLWFSSVKIVHFLLIYQCMPVIDINLELKDHVYFVPSV